VPKFTYCGDPGREYPFHDLRDADGERVAAPEPGVAYELADDPGDGRWQPAKSAKSRAVEEKP
jgi:hypothetical protein